MTGGDPERAAWLRLAALNETARRKNRLLEVFGSPAALFDADDAAWAALGADSALRDRVRQGARRDVSADLAQLDELQAALVVRGDVRYPPLLATIADPPPVLFVRGALPPDGALCVALVGTRGASPYGELMAAELARELAEAGVVVISGLAAGVDAAAHQGALRAGGLTVGVLGTGVERAYPAENRALFGLMAQQGGLLSEFGLGTQPRGWHFPMRNRIISGLSRAVVVVQAPERSGALVTARLAAEQDREVMAVPGNVTDRRQAGCHELIRDGATLVRGGADILAALDLEAKPQQAAPAPAPLPELSPLEATVAGAIGLVPLAIDDLIDSTRLSTPEVQATLVGLELKQVVRRLPGNRFVRQA